MPKPEGIISKVICKNSGLLPSSMCKNTYDEIFIQGSEPNKICDICPKGEINDNIEMNDIPSSLLKNRKPKYNIYNKKN